MHDFREGSGGRKCIGRLQRRATYYTERGQKGTRAKHKVYGWYAYYAAMRVTNNNTTAYARDVYVLEEYFPVPKIRGATCTFPSGRGGGGQRGSGYYHRGEKKTRVARFGPFIPPVSPTWASAAPTTKRFALPPPFLTTTACDHTAGAKQKNWELKRHPPVEWRDQNTDYAAVGAVGNTRR